jgi:hypothetical protein
MRKGHFFIFSEKKEKTFGCFVKCIYICRAVYVVLKVSSVKKKPSQTAKSINKTFVIKIKYNVLARFEIK